MEIWIYLLAAAVGGYGLGAIPFAVLIARARGVNIFEAGSGNPGATNVKRAVGKGAGNLCFLLDVGKGSLAAGWPLLPGLTLAGGHWIGMAGLLGALVGHSYSIFIGFRGGKGVAVTIGGLLALMPLVVLIGLGVWLLLFQTTRIVSVASLGLGLSLPAAAFLLHPGRTPDLILSGLLAAVIVVRHRSNIARLIRGEEHAFRKPADPSPEKSPPESGATPPSL